MTVETENMEEWQKRAEAAEAALNKVKTETDARLIRAELKLEAVKAGMIDLDGLKLIETAELSLNEGGELAGAAEILVKLKRSKPWLFGGTASSSAQANPPRPEAARTRHASELSHEEWLAARAALLRRR